MRIALLQIRPHTESRSANLAHVLRRVVQAAEAVPAPDLLVLPACCDGNNAQGVTAAMAQGFGESLAAAAREWGLYLAAGFLRAGDGGVSAQACLYDPDGDVVAWGPAPERADGAAFETPLGRVVIGLGTGDASVGTDEPCDLLLLCRGQAGATDDTARLADVARKGKTVTCAVYPASSSGAGGDPAGHGRSVMFDTDGGCLASAKTSVEEMVVGEVTVAGP